MTFPVITHIDQVLPSLEGRQEFVVANKGLYTVIDYRYVLSDSFDDPFRKECRGLKFCSRTGELLARPLHKFFNWGEKEETSLSQVDFTRPHVVMEKMDGSMIHPCMVYDLDPEGRLTEELLLMTRMGHTEVAQAAERLFLDEVVSTEFGDSLTRGQVMRQLLEDGFTPIFEYVGPDNRIVEEYETSDLVLLQVRETESGVYAGEAHLDGFAEMLGVARAPTYPPFTGHDDVLAVHARDTGGEGVVLVFDNGVFVKIKSDEYRRLHRIKDDVSREHDLALVILEGKLDDALPLFDAATKAKVEAFRDELALGVLKATSLVSKLVMHGEQVDQKTFATQTLAGESNPIRSICFTVRKGGVTPRGAVEDFIVRHCLNAQKFEAVRELTGARLEPVSFFMEAA